MDAEQVAGARMEEVGYLRKHRVYTRVPLSQCYAETGRPPLSTGWVDTNKGTGDQPNYRSRWVGKGFRTDDRPELFAATPPLEAIKTIASLCASDTRHDACLAVIDVRRAYFYAPAQRRLFVKLPPEDYMPGDEEKCGLLQASLYGTRDAAMNRQ